MLFNVEFSSISNLTLLELQLLTAGQPIEVNAPETTVRITPIQERAPVQEQEPEQERAPLPEREPVFRQAQDPRGFRAQGVIKPS